MTNRMKGFVGDAPRRESAGPATSGPYKVTGFRYELTLPEIRLPERAADVPAIVLPPVAVGEDFLERLLQVLTQPPLAPHVPRFAPAHDVFGELLDAERDLAVKARELEARAREDDAVSFRTYLAPRGHCASATAHLLTALLEQDRPRPEPAGPAVLIDRARGEALVGEHLVYWRAFDRGDGSTLVRVAGVGRFVVGPGRDFDTPEPCFEFGSTRRRKARQVLYPLARAWCQLPQRGPRGRKQRQTRGAR